MASSEDVAVTDPRTVETVEVPATLRGAHALERDQKLGRYTIGELVGAGGMGEVYRAIDEELKRTVAIKVMRAVERGRDQLLEEARAMAKLSHPNVVVVYEAGLVDGRVFIAMEFIAGSTLRAWVKDRPWRDIVRMYVAAGRGLAALHAAQLVHRDFKPDNVLVGADGRPRVADFGLAIVEDTEPAVKGGTPRYMAPEQREAAATVDVRTDQFAFCVALWEAITGEPPGEPLATRAMPAHVRAALARGLATEPSARWPSLDALLAELERDPAARRRRIAAIGGVGALAVVAGYALATRGADPRSACDAAAAKIDAAWTPLDARVVGARFAGLHRAHAGTTFDLVRGELDGYSRGWADLRRDVCLATAVRKELTPHTSELEVACLDRLAGGLRALVDVLEREGDAATLDHAAAAVGQLRAPGECSDAQALDAIPPPPPELRARVARLQADHDHVDAEYRAGRWKQEAPLARANVKAADEVGYVPAQAEAMMSLALLESTQRDPAAERDYEQAITYAGAAHDDHVMNVAWRGLVGEAITRSHLDDAAERLRFAQAALARSGNAPLYETRLESSHSSLLLAKGDFAGALAMIDRALQIAERATLPPTERASLLNQRGRILQQAHRAADAIAAFESSKAIFESVLGPDEPNVAGALLNIANAEQSLGRLDDAERDLDRSAQMTEDELGPNSLFLGRVLNNRCDVRLARHDLRGATADCERALAIKTKVSGPSSAELASTLITMASLAEARDDDTAAGGVRARILAIHVGALGDHHPKVAQDYYDLAAAALRAGAVAKANDEVVRGLAIAEAAHEPTLAAEGQSALADVLLARGDVAGARAAIRLALAQHEELAHGSANADVALAVATDHDTAGRIEQAGGDLVAAERELRRAVELATPVAGAGQANLAGPLEHLGTLLAAGGKSHAAADSLARALAIASATSAPATQLARVGLALASARWADNDHPGALATAHAAQSAVAAAHDTPSILRARADAAAWLAAHR